LRRREERQSLFNILQEKEGGRIGVEKEVKGAEPF
jgi:hypothetical protein